MENEDIVLAFKGEFTKDLLTSIFQVMESRLEISPAGLKQKKKVNNVLVECLQNVYHHMEGFTDDEKSSQAGSAMFLVSRDKENVFRIFTGNPILNTNIETLKNKIEKVNAMSPDELKAHYVDTLQKTTLSDKGGAGLGFIDMARKSGHKIDYRFDPVNDRISFFSMMVLVD